MHVPNWDSSLANRTPEGTPRWHVWINFEIFFAKCHLGNSDKNWVQWQRPKKCSDKNWYTELKSNHSTPHYSWASSFTNHHTNFMSLLWVYFQGSSRTTSSWGTRRNTSKDEPPSDHHNRRSTAAPLMACASAIWSTVSDLLSDYDLSDLVPIYLSI